MNEQPTVREVMQSLYELYSDDIYRYARLTLGSDYDAYDVVQEVYVRACRSWSSYRGDANAKTWLLRIARNYIFDLYRRKRTERNFLASYNPPPVYDEAASIQAILEIEETLALMKHEYRQVIVLRHIESLSLQETAETLGWTEAKVRTTTHRAMTKLRKILGGDFHHEIRTGDV